MADTCSFVLPNGLRGIGSGFSAAGTAPISVPVRAAPASPVCRKPRRFGSTGCSLIARLLRVAKLARVRAGLLPPLVAELARVRAGSLPFLVAELARVRA